MSRSIHCGSILLLPSSCSSEYRLGFYWPLSVRSNIWNGTKFFKWPCCNCTLLYVTPLNVTTHCLQFNFSCQQQYGLLIILNCPRAYKKCLTLNGHLNISRTLYDLLLCSWHALIFFCCGFLSFLSDIVVCTVSHKLNFIMLSSRLFVTHTICLHFHFLVRRPGTGENFHQCSSVVTAFIPYLHTVKLQYTLLGDYWECVQPAWLPILTWVPSSIPPGTISKIRSSQGPHPIQHHDPCINQMHTRIVPYDAHICIEISLYTQLPPTSYVYWTVHHCDSWRIKDQLDVTCYFISFLMCLTCFGH